MLIGFCAEHYGFPAVRRFHHDKAYRAPINLRPLDGLLKTPQSAFTESDGAFAALSHVGCLDHNAAAVVPILGTFRVRSFMFIKKPQPEGENLSRDGITRPRYPTEACFLCLSPIRS